MVGDPVLRKVVGADLFGPVAGADLALAIGRTRRVLPCPLGIEQAGAQHLHRLRPVLVLRLVVLALHDDAGRHVGDADGAVGLVDVLAAGALRPVGVDAQVLVVDLDVDLLGLGQHRDGGGRGVDAAAALGDRHPLHPVRARFELQALEHVVPGDRGAGLAVAADSRLADGDRLELPALQVGVALVHAEQLGGEQRGLVAAGAGAHLEDGVARVGLVARQQQQLHLALQPGQTVLQRRVLALCHGAHFRIRLGVDQLLQVGQLRPCAFQLLDLGHDRAEVGIFLRQAREFAGVAGAFRHQLRQFVMPGKNPVELFTQIHRSVFLVRPFPLPLRSRSPHRCRRTARTGGRPPARPHRRLRRRSPPRRAAQCWAHAADG